MCFAGVGSLVLKTVSEGRKSIASIVLCQRCWKRANCMRHMGNLCKPLKIEWEIWIYQQDLGKALLTEHQWDFIPVPPVTHTDEI